MSADNFIPFVYKPLSKEKSLEKSNAFMALMEKRRSVRFFSNENVNKVIIQNIIMTASTAPSGAHKQPWSFVAIQNNDLKKKIRVAAEKEEYLNYNGRMSQEWIKDLKPFQTNWEKEFLTAAPWLIAMFKKPYDLLSGTRRKNYYVNESAGIAAGFLIAAIHHAGLVTLTHTPSPMGFLEKILDRPKNERAFLLLPVGYPSADCTVPNLNRKEEDEVITWKE